MTKNKKFELYSYEKVNRIDKEEIELKVDD